MPKARGYVLWEGASQLDGQPVVLIATRGSKRHTNEKTGAMIQTYILRSDIGPIEATKTGKDESICGQCVHRPKLNGTCYVRIDTGPNAVYKAYVRGKTYARPTRGEVAAGLFRGELVRLGSYGDPGAVPAEVWADVLRGVRGYTGYTHQWAREDMQELKLYCMASCDTEEEMKRAKALGWRVFFVVPTTWLDSHAMPEKTFLCPASERAGKKLNCNTCLACDGTGGHRASHVVIPVHGVAFKQVRFNNLITIGRAGHATM
jgi:hypothetical protein